MRRYYVHAYQDNVIFSYFDLKILRPTYSLIRTVTMKQFCSKSLNIFYLSSFIENIICTRMF